MTVLPPATMTPKPTNNPWGADPRCLFQDRSFTPESQREMPSGLMESTKQIYSAQKEEKLDRNRGILHITLS